jgi:Amidohydrolase
MGRQRRCDFPELVIVAGHIGYPWTHEMIAVATKYENVYIDTSAYTIRRYPPELVQYMKGYGRKKVMFGTNYPMITAAKALEGLDGLGLDAEARALSWAGMRRAFSAFEKAGSSRAEIASRTGVPSARHRAKALAGIPTSAWAFPPRLLTSSRPGG